MPTPDFEQFEIKSKPAVGNRWDILCAVISRLVVNTSEIERNHLFGRIIKYADLNSDLLTENTGANFFKALTQKNKSIDQRKVLAVCWYFINHRQQWSRASQELEILFLAWNGSCRARTFENLGERGQPKLTDRLKFVCTSAVSSHTGLFSFILEDVGIQVSDQSEIPVIVTFRLKNFYDESGFGLGFSQATLSISKSNDAADLKLITNPAYDEPFVVGNASLECGGGMPQEWSLRASKGSLGPKHAFREEPIFSLSMADVGRELTAVLKTNLRDGSLIDESGKELETEAQRAVITRLVALAAFPEEDTVSGERELSTQKYILIRYNAE